MKTEDTVAVMIVRKKDGKIALSQRRNTKTFKGFFQFVGGKVEKIDGQWELLKVAAIRELKEESGLKITEDEIKCIFHVDNDPTCDNCWFYRVNVDGNPKLKTEDKNLQTPWEWYSPLEASKLEKLMPGILSVIKREFPKSLK